MLARLVSTSAIGATVVVLAFSEADALFWWRTPGESPLSLPSVESSVAESYVLGASFAALTDSLVRHTEQLAAIPSIQPAAGSLSSPFLRNRPHPILGGARPHNGIDVSAPLGTPIVAPAAGRVTRVARDRGYGLVVEIDHGQGVVTRYAHCAKSEVLEGQRVTRGDVIAAVGNSGLSTGPHLHYEIRLHGRLVDPLMYAP